MNRSSCAIVLLALGLTACSQPDPQQRTSAALAEGVILPAYSAWQQS
ncbi:imelysin, partial [Lactobacillus rhamnosus]|nr:imelysin [Lacticaseibacillus rhamnosus]